jgi:hypothetical protein
MSRGSRQEMNYLRNLLEDPRGTGADRQITLFQETGSIDALIQFLIQQTISRICRKVSANCVTLIIAPPSRIHVRLFFFMMAHGALSCLLSLT